MSKKRSTKGVQHVQVAPDKMTGYTATRHSGNAVGDAWRAILSAYQERRDRGGGTDFGMRTVDVLAQIDAILAQAGEGPHDEQSTPDLAKQIRGEIDIAKARIEAGDADVAARFAFDAGVLYGAAMMQAQWNELAFMGKRQRKAKSDLGKLGATARWGDRDQRAEVEDIIGALARRADELGDPIPSADLWSELIAALDAMGAEPRDTSGEKVKDSDRVSWAGNADGIAFKSFKNKLSEARKRS